MEHVVLVIHLMLAVSIIALVLVQRSEGGGLGIGGGGGLGGLATPGGTASAMTKITGILAFCFFGTSLILGIMAGAHGNSKSILDEINQLPAAAEQTIDENNGDVLIETEMPETLPSVPVE
ncbi:MAG: preprotein translocase subunit SecG [Alphaproteobacteria bacterium CG_4_9_14_3_um_filter_47_13]|nr:MAG: preprotein translocase subunit SecG [Alphaproteobacteria bacterium CG_4_9_14_3_um_filter_47_13]